MINLHNSFKINFLIKPTLKPFNLKKKKKKKKSVYLQIQDKNYTHVFLKNNQCLAQGPMPSLHIFYLK